MLGGLPALNSKLSKSPGHRRGFFLGKLCKSSTIQLINLRLNRFMGLNYSNSIEI